MSNTKEKLTAHPLFQCIIKTENAVIKGEMIAVMFCMMMSINYIFSSIKISVTFLLVGLLSLVLLFFTIQNQNILAKNSMEEEKKDSTDKDKYSISSK